jgi:hypothetical protein
MGQVGFKGKRINCHQFEVAVVASILFGIFIQLEGLTPIDEAASTSD